jgi:succinoglycan biosynthesis transport protein ExoP
MRSTSRVIVIEFSSQTRGAGVWLAGEIDNLRHKVVEAEAKAEDFRSRTNLLVGTNNTSLSHQQLGEFNSQLAGASGQKADAESRARIIRDMLRRGEPIDASEVVNSELIRRLSEQRVTLRAQLAEQSSTLLDGHPRIKELKAQIGDLDHQIRAEAERLVRALENDARIAGGRVDALGANLDALKRQAASTNEEDVQFRALEREAKAQRDLLESYLARYRETTARESIGNAPPDAKIISSAIVSNTPYFPKKMPIVTVATLIAFIVSAGLVTTSELLRATAGGGGGQRGEGEGEDEGFAPAIAGRVEPPVASAPSEPAAYPLQAREGREGSAAEPFASHRPSGEAPGTLSVVARRLRESVAAGRAVAVFSLSDAPTTQPALNLARMLAADAKVVLVGLLKRAPVLDAVAVRPHMPGLSEVVRGRASFGEVLGKDRLSRLHLVSFGASDVPLSALLSSRRFAVMMEALTRAYDHIIIDAGRLGDEGLRLARVAPRCVVITPERGAPAEVQRLAAAGFADIAILTERDVEADRSDRHAA